MSYLLGGIAHATGNVSTDISKDMEYERMRGHATFLQELKNQDAASGYVNKDGVSITNKDFNNMDSNAQSLLKSKVSADYERTLEGYKDKNEVDDKYALRKEGRAAEQKDIDRQANTEAAIAVDKGQLENRSAISAIADQKADEKLDTFLESDTFKGLPKDAQKSMKFGVALGIKDPKLLAGMIKKAEEVEIASSDLEIAQGLLSGNSKFQELQKKGDTLGMAGMMNLVAKEAKGGKSRETMETNANTVLAMVEQLRDPKELENFIDTASIEQKAAVGAYVNLIPTIDVEKTSMLDPADPNAPNTGRKFWDVMRDTFSAGIAKRTAEQSQ